MWLLLKWLDLDTFALVINYLNKFWTFMNDILGLFEVHETMRLSMDNYNLYLKIMI
jgi:hypothetical protein